MMHHAVGGNFFPRTGTKKSVFPFGKTDFLVDVFFDMRDEMIDRFFFVRTVRPNRDRIPLKRAHGKDAHNALSVVFYAIFEDKNIALKLNRFFDKSARFA